MLVTEACVMSWSDNPSISASVTGLSQIETETETEGLLVPWGRRGESEVSPVDA